MRAIVISDVHGNIDVLRALELEWGAGLKAFDRIICLGDLVDYGPEPAEVVDWVRSRATDVVRGNHDHAVATGDPCGSSPTFLEASILTRQRLASTLARGEIEYLRSLPYTAAVTDGSSAWNLVHATPRDALHEYVPPGATDEQWTAALDGLADSLVLVGHTHLPFVRSIGKGSVANPGSLGMPKDGDPRGSYAVLEDGKIDFHRVSYDPEPMIKRLQRLDLPGRVFEQLARTFRTGQ